MASSVTFDLRQPVDFAIIGSGSAGGIIAKELSTAGFNVVVFEQGPYRKAQDFTHDEYSVLINSELLGGGQKSAARRFDNTQAKRPKAPGRNLSATRRRLAAVACISPATSGDCVPSISTSAAC